LKWLSAFAAFAAFTAGARAAMLDQDGDGLSDLWQQMHLGLVPHEDSDRDGFSNATEASAGTSPLDANSFPALHCQNTPLGIQLHWTGIPGKSYTIEKWEPLTSDWVETAHLVANAPGMATHPLAAQPASGIFRLKIRDIDQDGDGLNAWEEHLLGLSDDSMQSSGEPARLDYSAALRRLEGSGTLILSDNTEVQKRPTPQNEATRFLVQASFGPDPDLIQEVMTIGIGGWMDQQLNHPTKTLTASTMLGQGGNFTSWWSRGWWKAAMTGPDQIRIRLANALSQILVISALGNDLIRQNSYGQADFYDIFLYKGLGNYRNILEDVTYHNLMGFYLSHLYNRKSDPVIGRFPDENFAREIMQLFTIGLWELNPDGTRKFDENGDFIPTYDNATIMEMAKVFTGFGFGGPAASNFFSPISGSNHYRDPMIMWDDQHEPGEKHIINGVVIPAGQTGNQDVADTLDALCEHPNIGPFIGRLLIQRFTTSNPSPAYIRRVAEAWNDNGSNVKGDLKAVMDAILMDPEARTSDIHGDNSGMVREPYLRLAALMRVFKARNSRTPPTFPVVTSDFPRLFGQQPLSAPSVFNFYLPDHSPAGELRNRGLLSPELEIATADRLINTDNFLQRVIDRGMDPFTTAAADILHCDFTIPLSLASNPATLVDYLDTLLTWGQMSASTRQIVIQAVQAQTTPELKVETAVHLIVESPDFVVLK
jgi:uncharacterized protein (DUF1800 family)